MRLEFKDGYWWIIQKGKKKINAGRSKTYAEKMIRDLQK